MAAKTKVKEDKYQPEGIFHLTGEPDTGKTTCALGAYHPKNTAYIFDDVKSPPIDKGQFGVYIDLVKDSLSLDLKMLDFYDMIMEIVKKLPEMDSIIFDTWGRTGASVRYYAKANPLKYREQSTFSKNGTIKNMEQWKEASRVEADVISAISQKCKALFLITHIKPQIIGGVKSGSFEPDCGKSFNKVCNLRLWLRHNPKSGVPVALTLKRIPKIEVTEQGIQPVNVLPRRIEPHQDHNSVWDAINHYWNNPVGNREPEENEIPSAFELSILDGILTDDQKEMWRAELESEKQREKEEKELSQEMNNDIKSMAQALAEDFKGQPIPLFISKILPEIHKSYPDVTSKEISEILS